LDVRSGTVYAVWNTFALGSNTLATAGSTGAGTYLVGQGPTNLFDNNFNTKYSSRGNSSTGTNSYAGLNTGFIMTIAECQPVLNGFRFGNAYNNSDREPLTVTIEGTNCAVIISTVVSYSEVQLFGYSNQTSSSQSSSKFKYFHCTFKRYYAFFSSTKIIFEKENLKNLIT
jgi:hypothetical protein